MVKLFGHIHFILSHLYGNIYMYKSSYFRMDVYSWLFYLELVLYYSLYQFYISLLYAGYDNDKPLLVLVVIVKYILLITWFDFKGYFYTYKWYIGFVWLIYSYNSRIILSLFYYTRLHIVVNCYLIITELYFNRILNKSILKMQNNVVDVGFISKKMSIFAPSKENRR